MDYHAKTCGGCIHAVVAQIEDPNARLAKAFSDRPDMFNCRREPPVPVPVPMPGGMAINTMYPLVSADTPACSHHQTPAN